MARNLKLLELSREIFHIPLAKMISSGAIKPEDVDSREKFLEVIERIGVDPRFPFENYYDDSEEQLAIMGECLRREAFASAAILMFTRIEARLNESIRVLLHLRGFSHKKISDHLKETSVTLKFDLLLPLLGVTIGERLRSKTFELRSIRNLVVHTKGEPDIEAATESKAGSREVLNEKSKTFFVCTKLEDVEDDLKNLDSGVFKANPALSIAGQIVARYTSKA